MTDAEEVICSARGEAEQIARSAVLQLVERCGFIGAACARACDGKCCNGSSCGLVSGGTILAGFTGKGKQKVHPISIWLMPLYME